MTVSLKDKKQGLLEKEAANDSRAPNLFLGSASARPSQRAKKK